MIRLLPIALVLSLTVSVCARPALVPGPPVVPPVVTPAQIRQAITALQDAALIADEVAGQDKGTTRAIVTFTRDADATLTLLPSGWRAALAASWVRTKPTITALSPPVVAAIAAVDGVLLGP